MTTQVQRMSEYFSSVLKTPLDPRGSQFPLIRDGPFALISLLTSLLILLKVIGPMWMRHRKPYDLRPWMLIFNGTMFGMNGAGFFMTLVLTEGITNCWTCGASDPQSLDLRPSAIVLLGFVYFLIKFMEFARIGFAVMRKRDHQASLAAFTQPSLVTLVIFAGLLYYPGDIFCFLPMMDTLTNSITYGYYVLATAKQISSDKYKKHLVLTQMLSFVLIFTHAIWFLSQPSCKAPHIVLFFQALYSGLCLVSYPFVFAKVFSSQSLLSKDPSQTSSLTKKKLHSN